MITQRKRRHGSRDGFAMASVIGVLILGSVLVGTILAASRQRAYTAHRLANRARAQSLAETGIAEAYSILITNFDARTTAQLIPSTSFGGGSYEVAARAVGDDAVVLCATGHYAKLSIPVTVDLVRRVEGTVDGVEPANPFSFMILSGKSMKWKLKSKKPGDLEVTGGGGVHANGPMTIEGPNVSITADLSSSKKVEVKADVTVDGDVTAPDLKLDCGEDHVTGDVAKATVPKVAIPEVDLTPYYAEAVRNGEVHNGDVTIGAGSSVNLVPNGGVMWINGKLTVEGSGVMVGCFIATGDIVIKGSITQTKVGDFPALISVNKKIEIKDLGTYHGLVYAPKGDVKFKKSKKSTGAPQGMFTGTIIAGNKFEGEGPWTFMGYEDSTPVDPNGDKTEEKNIIIGIAAWQR